MFKSSKSNYPSQPHILKNLLSEAYKTAKQGLCGDRVLAKKETVDYRLGICATCDKFNAEEKRCTLCGCFMMVKANLEAANCPGNKW
ncbi:MAG: hypothetical protein AAFX80_06755 [Cyanobacteria bacterium J06639_18]